MPTPNPPSRPARLVVLISGGGRSLLNIQDAIDAGRLGATIPLVIASRDCPGVQRAKARSLRVLVEPGQIPRNRLAALLEGAKADLVALAGYLQLVEIPPGFEGRIVNIHPALLPAFGGPGMYGHHVHQAVLKSGAKESGCTVHLVDAQYDRGPILLQYRCPVLPGDTPDILAARVFELECQAYPTALQMLIEKRTGAQIGPNQIPKPPSQNKVR